MKEFNTILVLGINHTSAPVALREKVDSEKIFRAICTDLFPHLVSEFFILATCNRLEIYMVTTNAKLAEKKLKKIFLTKNYYHYTHSKTIDHILEVAAGLDSMILGETEILAQIRQAYKNATQKKTIGPILHQLCKDSLRVGRLARNTTHIGKGITSTAQATILLAKKHLGVLTNKKIVLVGAGDIAERVLHVLQKQEVTNITVSNRTYSHAIKLTKKYGGAPAGFEELPKLIEQSDLLISATASPEIIISAAMAKKIMKKRLFKPLCLIDLAVPRDIDVQVSKIEGVHLYNIDAMQHIVNANMAIRNKAVRQVQKIIEKETRQFIQWLETRKAVPLLTALTNKSDAIKEKELAIALQKLSHLNTHDKKVIAILAKRLESKILARPIANLKQVSQMNNSEESLALVKMLFEL